MFSKLRSALFLPVFSLFSFAYGTQVDKRSVGALTLLSAKTKICNILDYGGVADNKTDIGPAIKLAFSSCAVSGGATLYIPPGSYSLATGVVLNKGTAFAFQIDGLITLTSDGSFSGNAVVIENASDVEVFSSNALGAINGQGYITRSTGSSQNARLFRFISSTYAYQITIRGPNQGGTDGIDLICTDNCYLHDIEVTNRDECISVKTPSQNVLIEDVYCNQSGGMSIGSLTANVTSEADVATVSNITMRNIYVYQCTQMLMIKTWPGGSGAMGYVKDSVFENFWAYDATYGLGIDQYWYSHTTPDTGAVALSGLTFNNWTGTVDNGVSRGPIVIRGSDIVPLTDITLSNFDMWTVNENEILNQCKNVYGTGYCAGISTGLPLTTFTTTATTTARPSGFTSPVSPEWGVSGYGITIPIPVYTPAVFWSPVSSGVAGAVSTTPSVLASTTKASTKSTASSVIASSAASTSKSSKTSASSVILVSASSSAPSSLISSPTTSSASTKVVVVVTSSTSIFISSTTSGPTTGVALSKWSQCGGQNWSGSGTCASGTCTIQNPWYSQCL